MPLFNPKTSPIKKSGQMQEVLCPRCKSILDPEQHQHYGDGAQTRIVEGDYKCVCGYEVKVVERYPVISRAVETEKHI